MAGQTGRVACAGCHIPASGFSDTRSFQLEISLGAGWGRRRAPSLLDVGQARLLMWDGRHDALYNQPFGPLETVVEMNSSRLYMAEQLYASYQADYEAVFGPMPPLGDAAQFPPLERDADGLPADEPHRPAADLRRHVPRLARRSRRVRRHDRGQPDRGHAGRGQCGKGPRRLRATADVRREPVRRLDARGRANLARGAARRGRLRGQRRLRALPLRVRS